MIIEQSFFKINACLLLFLITFTSCDNKNNNEESKNNKHKPYIVATTTTIYDALIQIGKNKINQGYIVGPGVDPHTYNANHNDLNKLKKADMIFYNGFHLEAKMIPVLKKLARNKPVISLAKAVPSQKIIKPGGSEKRDPHIWFDIDIWKKCVTRMTEKLGDNYKQHKSFFNKNCDIYLKKLDDLKGYINKKITQIPENKRILITSHDAFSYFGKAYDIKVKGLQGISTSTEEGLRDITNLVDFIIKKDIHALFIERSVSGKSMEAVIEGCRSKDHKIKMGGSLYADGLGEISSKEGTYIGMMKNNINTISKSLK